MFVIVVVLYRACFDMPALCSSHYMLIYDTIHDWEAKQMNARAQKETQEKLTKGLLDMIILEHLTKEGMHGYKLITTIRKEFGIYFGPSTIYPLLGLLEKKGFVKSTWNMTAERPRKVFIITEQGKNLLAVTENSLHMICQRISPEITIRTQSPAMIISQ
jgi:DNA-binding PadR family transcriptional regulator